ncbi:response regulator [Roseobacter sp.]|uniref:response regulator n=1 Tax=Roseobacter sp. TaxID=1907202 RepID=UPI002966B7DC|nr:response regulator [Roseobacter sp.]MDW3182108.1 response regulator [Roseobacter sp.]
MADDQDLLKSFGRVMLIEDDLVDRMTCQRLLRRLGLAEEVLCFADAEAALLSMETDGGFEADVIFLDINMPRMNGLEFLQEIHKSEKVQFSGVVAVMVSTDLTAELQMKFEEIQYVKAFIRKPMTADELAAVSTEIEGRI